MLLAQLAEALESFPQPRIAIPACKHAQYFGTDQERKVLQTSQPDNNSSPQQDLSYTCIDL